MGLSGGKGGEYPGATMGDEALMAPKAHGTCPAPVQQNLMYGCDRGTADKICCFNRHYAEHSGYAWKTSWVAETKDAGVGAPRRTLSGRGKERVVAGPSRRPAFRGQHHHLLARSRGVVA
mmetsp:Transcript_31815/g.98280  ORF Transcript_31815/g.98280 Transcript_31815/m.98280 type:complete len:120 (+) Transcript_31815:427-786(+)